MLEVKLSVTVVPLVPLTVIALPVLVMMPKPLVVVTVTGVPMIVCVVSPPAAGPEHTEFGPDVQLPAHAGAAPKSVPPNTSPAARAAEETADDI